MCCFRGKPEKQTIGTSVSVNPASLKNIGQTLSPVTVTSNTADEPPDSFAKIQPSIKTAKRADEIKRQGSVSGRRKKQYKTFNVEDMSDFNKTMELPDPDEFTCISGEEKKMSKK